MKRSDTDKEFIDLIVNTLETHEEQYILGSWENFVRKRKQRKKLILWFTTSGIAASLLIGWLGVRFFVADSSSINADSSLQPQIAGKMEITVKKDTPGDHLMIQQDLSVPGETKYAPGQGNAVTGPDFNTQKSAFNAPEVLTDAGKLLSDKVISQYERERNVQDPEKQNSDRLPDSVKNVSPSQPVTAGMGGTDNLKNEPDTSALYNAVRLADVEIVPENEDDTSGKNRSQRIRLGLNFSPGVTSTSTVSSFNYSGGISADLDLSRSFRLSTGLQVERQNVINRGTDNPSWIPSGQTQAVLVGLDLPINITWKFLRTKSISYYVSSGISSTAYLSEKYVTTSYSQKMVGVVNVADGETSVAYELENVKSTEQKSEDALNTFDFAGRINIILGFEKHLSSKLLFHVEPYMKIPVSKLATENLRFTTSGITCKISF